MFNNRPCLISFRSDKLLLLSLGPGNEIINDIVRKISYEGKLNNYKSVVVYLDDLNKYGYIILNFFKSDTGFIVGDSIIMHNNVMCGFKMVVTEFQVTLIFKCLYILTSLTLDELLQIALPDFNNIDITDILNTCEISNIFQNTSVLCDDVKTLGTIGKYAKIFSHGNSSHFDLREFMYNYVSVLSFNF